MKSRMVNRIFNQNMIVQPGLEDRRSVATR
jgi:hypothetical protein